MMPFFVNLQNNKIYVRSVTVVMSTLFVPSNWSKLQRFKPLDCRVPMSVSLNLHTVEEHFSKSNIFIFGLIILFAAYPAAVTIVHIVEAVPSRHPPPPHATVAFLQPIG
jgi:hypothetical protein